MGDGPGTKLTQNVDVTFPSQNIIFKIQCDAARFFLFLSSSKNLPGTGTNVNVMISSFRHIILLGSAWTKPGFETMARSWVPGAGFFDSGKERPSNGLLFL